MWRVIWFFLGVSRLSITGASPEWCMQRLAKARIAFHFCAKPDDFTAEVWILRRDEARAAQLVRMGGCDCAVIERGGFSTVFGGLRKRPALLILLAAAIAAGIVVPKYVFFYEVEGNEAVPSAQILRELRELGVGFGTYGPSIKPQELKNQMLLRIPKLQWLTVQQSGMCARVVVRERPDKAPVLDRKVPTDVIASRAGVLTRVEAVAGNCLCAPGQAVAGGDLRRDGPAGRVRPTAGGADQDEPHGSALCGQSACRTAAHFAFRRGRTGRILRKRDKNAGSDAPRRVFFAFGDCNYKNL